MSALVYQAINAIAAELADKGIPKAHRNEERDYAYRSIEDVLSALAPLLARHKLCVLPRVLERHAVRWGRAGQLVTVRAAFDLISALDASVHTIESFGEALDDSDKGTAKAISTAYKSAMLQAFCVPVLQEDSDATSAHLNNNMNGVAIAEPPEGWDSWTGEVIHIAQSCESSEAIDRLTAARRAMLSALQHSRPELYASIGDAVAERLSGLQLRIQAKTQQAMAPAKETREPAQNRDAEAHTGHTGTPSGKPKLARKAAQRKRSKETAHASATAEAA